MSIDRMILLVTGISAGIELIFGYRWQLTERVKCGPEILQSTSTAGLSGSGPRRPNHDGKCVCAWLGGMQ